jgi:hypothetical protein
MTSSNGKGQFCQVDFEVGAIGKWAGADRFADADANLPAAWKAWNN